MTVPVIQSDIRLLAPYMGCAVGEALNRCHRHKLDVIVYESRRSDALQAYYYAQGRTRPGNIITNASSGIYGWHYYGLAVDVISASRQWSVTAEWQKAVAEIFEDCGLDWAGRWQNPDYPHYQWGTLRSSPSDRARELLNTGGVSAVWKAVGAA